MVSRCRSSSVCACYVTKSKSRLNEILLKSDYVIIFERHKSTNLVIRQPKTTLLFDDALRSLSESTNSSAKSWVHTHRVVVDQHVYTTLQLTANKMNIQYTNSHFGRRHSDAQSTRLKPLTLFLNYTTPRNDTQRHRARPHIPSPSHMLIMMMMEVSTDLNSAHNTTNCETNRETYNSIEKLYLYTIHTIIINSLTLSKACAASKWATTTFCQYEPIFWHSAWMLNH